MIPLRYAFLAVFLAGLVLPAVAAGTSSYGYLDVNKVTITLDHGDARVRMDYTLTGGMQILVFLLGTSDLEMKVKRVLNFDRARVEEIDLSHAVVRVEGASIDYRDGTYWFPEHRFSVTVPQLTVRTPQYARTYWMTPDIPQGIGYYVV